MGEDSAISVQNVSKCFKRYERPVDRLKELLIPGKKQAREFWALKDINFEVAKGETLGIIGQNGSGKSTLLQIIAQTMEPTTGQIVVNGRISALLELGCGFNPEFTGRQNVFFNGQILGLSRSETEDKFDDIVAFAEIGSFLEQPVKTYSSGMVVRLAFAVAAHTDPKILIVDEALAVGDAKFQARCMKRIRQLKEQKVTILFVSHDSSSVKMICDHAALMHHGKILETGHPKDVVNHYIGILSSAENREDLEILFNQNNSQEAELKTIKESGKENSSEYILAAENISAYRHGNNFVNIKNVKITNSKNQLVNQIETGQVLKVYVFLQANADLLDLVVGISIRNLMGVVIYGTNTFLLNNQTLKISQAQSITVAFQIPCRLNKGVYTITIGLHSEADVSYEWIDDLIVFEVINSRRCDGIVDLDANVQLDDSANMVQI